MTEPRVVLGIAGASGALLGLEVARHLARLEIAFDLTVSTMAQRTLALEVGPTAHEEVQSLAKKVHPIVDLGARIASGSAPIAGMIVAPCSMRSLAAIAIGLDDTLLTRAASVQLKERRPLVLLTREAPLTLAHLRNMTVATEMGATILPPVPAFYLCPETTGEIAKQIAARAVDLLHIRPMSARAWQG